MTSNLIRDAIQAATIPKLASAFNLTSAAIASWSANKKVPWPHLVRLAELSDTDLKTLMDANSDAQTQVFRGTSRPLTLLKDLADLETAVSWGGGEVNHSLNQEVFLRDDALKSLSAKHDIELRLLKVMVKTTKSFKLEYDTLTSLDQLFPDKATQRAALAQASSTLGVGVHEVNRRLRRWGITPPPLASVAARRQLQGRRTLNKERLAIAVQSYIKGSHNIEDAAALGETSSDYLYRLARNALDVFGESLRELRSFPDYVRAALAEDAYRILRGDADNQALYSDSILRLYRKVGNRVAKPVPASPRDGYVELLPAVVRDEISTNDVAAFKETPEDTVKQRFTGLLVGIGLTWGAVERMSSAHREALYQLLIRKPAETP